MIADEPLADVTKIDRHLTWAILVILAVTVWRIACLALNNVDLFVDETQYWLWGQEPALGYFSKPPLIGWVIRAFNEIGQSDAAFWIRLPAILGHGGAGLILALLAREIWQSTAAAWAGAAYATLPGTAVLSLFVSTDDILMPCYAAALLALAHLQKRQSTAWALGLGLAFGLGLLSKYAMIYGIGLAAIAQLIPRLRINWRDFGVALALAGVLILPNLLWNAANSFITFGHTAENADWKGVAWNWPGLAEFVGTQIMAFGPIFGPAFLMASFGAWRGERTTPFLLLFSMPIFLALSAQALIEDANGNWAAPAFAAGVVLVSGWLLSVAPRVFAIGLTLNAVIALLFPLSTIWPERMKVGGESIYARALGMHDLGRAAAGKARSHGITHLVAADRAILAELTYQAKGTGLAVFSVPSQGVPTNHYAFTRPMSGSDLPALFVSRSLVACETAQDIGEWVMTDTRPDTTILRFYLMTENCWPHEVQAGTR